MQSINFIRLQTWWDNKLVLTIICCITVGLIPVFLTLLGVADKSFSNDFVSQIVPLTIETKRMLASGYPLWSWNSFLGDNFIGSNNFYVLGTPFTLICTLFPYKINGVGILICLYLQFILYGITSMLYFRRMGFDRDLGRLGALMYSLSCFCIMAMFYFNFAIGFILFPIFLIGIENLISQNKYSFTKLAVIAGVMVVCNFYFAALSFIGGGLYFIFRIFCKSDSTILLSTKLRLRLILQFTSAILLGLMFSAFIFVPTIMATGGSERNTIGSIYDSHTQIWSAVKLLFYTIVPRISEGRGGYFFSPFASYSLYVPCISFALLFQFLIKQKCNWLTWLILAYLIIGFTPFNIIMSLGANVDYQRWNYIILVCAILASLYVLKMQIINKRILTPFFILSFCYVIANLCLIFRSKNLNISSPIWNTLFPELILYIIGTIIAIWALYSRSVVKRLYIGVSIMGTLCLMTFTYCNYTSDPVFTDIFKNPIPVNDDAAFKYRIDIEGAGPNISMIKNVPTPTSFHSIMNKSITRFGACYRPSIYPFFRATHHRASFITLLSVKDVYKMDNRDLFIEWKYKSDITEGLDSITRGNGYSVFRNTNYIPMGFAYDSYATDEEFYYAIGPIDYDQPENNKDVGLAMLEHLVLDSITAKELSPFLTHIPTFDFAASLDSVATARRTYCCSRFEGDTHGFKAEVNNPGKARVYFFSTPADPGFTATLDGQQNLKIYKANLGMIAVVIPSGRHTIEFHYLTPGLVPGCIVSLIALLLICALVYCEHRKCRHS